MFSREEAKRLRKEFWTTYGVYMRKHSMEYGKVKWLNYRTGIKDIYIRLYSEGKLARVSIDIQHSDDGIRELFWEQFGELKRVLTDLAGEDLVWEEEAFLDDGRPISRIGVEKHGLHVFNKKDWAELFKFFERYQVPFHEFWTDFKEIFVALES